MVAEVPLQGVSAGAVVLLLVLVLVRVVFGAVVVVGTAAFMSRGLRWAGNSHPSGRCGNGGNGNTTCVFAA